MFYIKKIKLMLPLGFAALFLHETLFGAVSLVARGARVNLLYVSKTALLSAFSGTVIFILLYQILKRVKSEKRKKGIRYERQI